LKEASNYLERLAVKRNGRMLLLAAQEIECIEADDNYVRLYSANVPYLLRETLTKLIAKLDPKRFMRVHRSAVVNIDKIAHIQPAFHGEYYLILTSGKQLTLSRTYRDSFFQRFGHPR
jgi:two-component system, LytTR family, response regulator